MNNSKKFEEKESYSEMEAERAAVSLQVYEEIDKSPRNPFLEYLEPALRENEVPHSLAVKAQCK